MPNLKKSGCVISDKGKTLLEELSKKHKILKDSLNTYYAVYNNPIKDGTSKRFLTLNWCSIDTKIAPSVKGNSRKLIIDSFLKHNKDLPQEVYSKVDKCRL